MRHSALYTLGFAAAVCLACSVVVTVSAVALRPRQERNQLLDRQRNVLVAAQLIREDVAVDGDQVRALFNEHVRSRLVHRQTGEYVDDEEALSADYDMLAASQDPDASAPAPPNPAQVQRVPDVIEVYEVVDEAGDFDTVVLPIYGSGLWGVMLGYIALEDDGTTVRGLTFYEHSETPGLGGEVDSSRWKALWPGRRVYDEEGDVAIRVIKGQAGPPEEDPHRIDALAGATITSRSVDHLLTFWLGPDGYLPYLEKFHDTETPQAQAT